MLRRLVTLAAAAALLGGVALLVSRRADRLEAVQPLKAFPADYLFRIELSRQGETGISIEKKAGQWHLDSPVDDIADDRAAEDLLASLADLTIGTEVSGESESWPAYGLTESSATHVKVYSRDRAVPALDGYFGNLAPGDSFYFRWTREKAVLLAEGLSKTIFLLNPDGYREHAFFPEKLGPIQNVKLSAGSKTLEPTKDSREWATAVHLRAAEFIAGKTDAAQTGLDHPALVVEAAGSVRSARWLIGNPVIEKGRKTPFRYAACDGRPGVLAAVAVSDADVLLKSLKP